MWLIVAFRNLLRNVRRTIAIVLTVAIGAGALFSFAGFISGILDEYRETTIHSHYGYGQIHTKGYRDAAYEDPIKHWIADWPHLSLFLAGQEEVSQVFPRVSFSALLKNGKTTVSGHGEGVEGEREADFFSTLNVEEGETLRDQPHRILLGKGLATALNVHPGDTVTVIGTTTKSMLKDRKFTVVGIFHTGNAHFDKNVFRIPLQDAQELLKTSSVESISLGLRQLSDWQKVANVVQEKFPNLEATSFDELDRIYYKHSVDWLNAQFGVVRCIILGIVLLGIFNTVSASILERKQEIGNLRANGESVLEVMRLIVAEGAFLALIGSFVGIGATYLVLMGFVDQGLLMPPGPGQTRQFVVTFSFTWPLILETVLYNALAAVVASFLAGIKVARMGIAQALRST